MLGKTNVKKWKTFSRTTERYIDHYDDVPVYVDVPVPYQVPVTERVAGVSGKPRMYIYHGWNEYYMDNPLGFSVQIRDTRGNLHTIVPGGRYPIDRATYRDFEFVFDSIVSLDPNYILTYKSYSNAQWIDYYVDKINGYRTEYRPERRYDHTDHIPVYKDREVVTEVWHPWWVKRLP